MSDKQSEKEKDEDEGWQASDAEWSYNRQPSRRRSMTDRLKRKWRAEWRPRLVRNTGRTALMFLFGVLVIGVPTLMDMSFVDAITQAVMYLEPATRIEAVAVTAALTVLAVLAIVAAWTAVVWGGTALLFSDLRDERSLWQLIKSRPSILLAMIGGFYCASSATLLAGSYALRLATSGMTLIGAIEAFVGIAIFLYVLVWALDSIYRYIYKTEEDREGSPSTSQSTPVDYF